MDAAEAAGRRVVLVEIGVDEASDEGTFCSAGGAKEGLLHRDPVQDNHHL